MQLVLVAHGGRTAFKIRDVRVVIGNDECALKLARIPSIDTEIRAELHRTTNPLGDIDEGAIAEHCRVQGCKEVILVRHYRSQVLPHQVAMLLDGLTDGTEDDALLA